MTLDQIKNLINSQLEKSGWTVADDGSCYATESKDSTQAGA